MIKTLGIKRIEELRTNVTSGESSEMSPIVDTWQQTYYKEPHDPYFGLLSNATAAGSMTIVEDSPNQTGDRC